MEKYKGDPAELSDIEMTTASNSHHEDTKRNQKVNNADKCHKKVFGILEILSICLTMVSAWCPAHHQKDKGGKYSIEVHLLTAAKHIAAPA